MRRCLSLLRCLILGALLFGFSGAHWSAFQTYAWTGMLLDNWRAGSLSEAVSKTFDGRHPCKVCQSIEKARHKEKAPDKALRLQKLEAVLTASIHFPEPIPVPRRFFPSMIAAQQLALPPPTPPPRLA